MAPMCVCVRVWKNALTKEHPLKEEINDLNRYRGCCRHFYLCIVFLHKETVANFSTKQTGTTARPDCSEKNVACLCKIKYTSRNIGCPPKKRYFGFFMIHMKTCIKRCNFFKEIKNKLTWDTSCQPDAPLFVHVAVDICFIFLCKMQWLDGLAWVTS
jgi:hypothetical protein